MSGDSVQRLIRAIMLTEAANADYRRRIRSTPLNRYLHCVPEKYEWVAKTWVRGD